MAAFSCFMINDLKKIGLTDNEIKIYLNLFKLGVSIASNIAEKTNIHRTNVYDSLEKLIKKGLVAATIKNDVKYFSATDPNNLLAYIEKKKQELKKDEKSIRGMISELRSIKPIDETKQKVSIFQDRVGLETFYEKLINIAKSRDEVLIIGSSERILEVLDYYILNLTKRILEINVRGKMIANREIMKDELMKKIIKFVELEMRFLPRDYLNPTATFIFKNHVGFCNFIDNPFVVLIEDNTTFNVYRKHFKDMWKKANK